MDDKIKSLCRSLTSFAFTFIFALAVMNLWKSVTSYNKTEKFPVSYQIRDNLIHTEKGRGSSGACFGKDDPGNKNLYINKSDKTEDAKLFIINKPKPRYTAAAKENNIQGTVRLRVTFLQNGEIGSVSEVAGLPFGLTENAIEAANKIKFKPEIQRGESVAVTKVVAYTFTNE